MADPATRLFRCLMLLQERRFWSGEDLARELGGVTARTVRRDVERLRDLGFPVHATSGVGGGYALAAGTQLPPLPFDDDEAIAVALGLRMASSGPVAGLEQASVRALGKLETVLPPRLRLRLRELEGIGLPMGADLQRVSGRVLAAIARACREHRVLRYTYRSPGRDPALRTVEPLLLTHSAWRWYLLAWDRDRDDWRTFRLDRMEEDGIVEGDRFRPRDPPAEDAEAWVREQVSTWPGRRTVRARVSASAEVVRQALPVGLGTVTPDGEQHCILELPRDDPERAALYLLMLGHDLQVPDDAEVRAAFARLALRCTLASETRSAGAHP